MGTHVFTGIQSTSWCARPSCDMMALVRGVHPLLALYAYTSGRHAQGERLVTGTPELEQYMYSTNVQYRGRITEIQPFPLEYCTFVL